MSDLVFTGERFLPDCSGEIWLEHWHRYHFAAAIARNCRVLDVASGEGYGSALLAATATAVTGLDASAEAISHAQATYGYLTNVRFLCGDCAALPFADGAFDLVVSFETIEHIRAQREFLAEVRRVLSPTGMLLISSPNKAEYSDRRHYENPFHVAELYRAELEKLLADHWSESIWYGQGVGFCSTIASLRPAAAAGELVGLGPEPEADAEVPHEPLYYLVGCASSKAPLERLQSAFSVLRDPDDTVYRDYQETYRKFVRASEAVSTYRAREAAAEQDRLDVRNSARTDIEFIQQRLAAALQQRDAALAGAAELQGEAARLRAEVDALKSLTAKLGEAAHSAQQATLRLTAGLHDANARYEAELQAAGQTSGELTATLLAERERQRDESRSQEARIAELRAQVEAQAAELDRRLGWQWRLRRARQG